MHVNLHTLTQYCTQTFDLKYSERNHLNFKLEIFQTFLFRTYPYCLSPLFRKYEHEYVYIYTANRILYIVCVYITLYYK